MDELSIAVPRHNSGPSLARAAVRDRFAGSVSHRRLEDLQVVVSELTTNALLHGAGAIGLRVLLDGGHLRGEVIDDGTGFERAVEDRGIDAVGGRGLRVVAALSVSWGIHEGTSHVWFDLGPGAGDEPVDPQLGDEERPDALD